MISVICPTIKGREDWAERCQTAYQEHTTETHEFILIHDRPTCGIGWNDGLDIAKGDYLHLTADDVEPTEGWDLVGIEWLHRKILPAPRILHTDGSLQSCGNTADEQPTGTPTELTRIPFFGRELVPIVCPIIETHYYTDSWVSYRARRYGWSTLVVRDFLFYHHFAGVGRLDDRLDDDYATFVRLRDRDVYNKGDEL